GSREESRRNREMMAQLPPDIRRIITFAAINAVERLAYNQFEAHLRCLDRPEDIETLESVMAEEKFHLSYVEGELERAEKGENGEVVTMALEQARTRFAEFQEMKRRESRAALQTILGGGACRRDRVGGPRHEVRHLLRAPDPATLGARRRAPPLQGGPRPGRARRPARYRLRLGGRAPFPGRVLALLGARGLP